MQALYLEIKNLIITTLNLDELTAEDIDTDAALFGDDDCFHRSLLHA